MGISDKDVKAMQKFAREGKLISRIQKENFSQYDYWDIYTCVYRLGERSSLGVKAMITARLNQLVSTRRTNERKIIIQEIKQLVSHLYERYKENQEKLEKIRKIL